MRYFPIFGTADRRARVTTFHSHRHRYADLAAQHLDVSSPAAGIGSFLQVMTLAVQNAVQPKRSRHCHLDRYFFPEYGRLIRRRHFRRCFREQALDPHGWNFSAPSRRGAGDLERSQSHGASASDSSVALKAFTLAFQDVFLIAASHRHRGLRNIALLA